MFIKLTLLGDKMRQKTNDLIKKTFKVLFGLVLVIVGIYGCIRWWPHLLTLIKGAIGPFVILIGLMFVIIGLSD